MNVYWRPLLVFFSILIIGWLSWQLSLYDYIGWAGVLLPGLLFGLSFSLVNFDGRRQKIRGVILISLFTSLSIALAFLLLFALGPEGTGWEGMKYGLLLGFGCAAPLTIMIYAVYGLSWPSAFLAVVLGSLLPVLFGFEGAQDATLAPELFAYFWLAVMGAVYSWGIPSLFK